MATELQLLGFERVSWGQKNIKGTPQKASVPLKKKPDTPCKAEVSLQQISIWRNKPSDRYYGAHSIKADLDRINDPTKINFDIELRDQKKRKDDIWSFSVRVLVMYYK